ncbi:MAG TPA: hypothetical protein VE545_05245 [Candidatus Dormibacteraeota bacterium]|nr:hypothetical protein [Candidatus Dormibacteraeota bacterium]
MSVQTAPCEREPLVPWAEICAGPVAAETAAANTTETGVAAVTVNGAAGLVDTPAGRPDNVTVTGPEKPFSGVIAMLIAELDAPGATLTIGWENWTAKSAAGGDG